MQCAHCGCACYHSLILAHYSGSIVWIERTHARAHTKACSGVNNTLLMQKNNCFSFSFGVKSIRMPKLDRLSVFRIKTECQNAKFIILGLENTSYSASLLTYIIIVFTVIVQCER